MRLLTPSELRQVERYQKLIRNIDASDEVHIIIIDEPTKELWLNVLDIALQTQEALLSAWRNTPKETS